MDRPKLIGCIVMMLAFSPLVAQDLVYRPINPAFGGDTFNYNWLLNSAIEQNQFTDDDLTSPFGSNLDNFEESFNRQILNLLSRELITSTFGNEGLQDGLYSIGSFEIEVSSNDTGINIFLLNTDDGSETTVVVPFF